MLLVAETLAVLLVFFALGVSLLAWRLLTGPMELGFARPYVLAALRDEASGVSASVGRIVMQWPEPRGPILLGIENGRLSDVDGRTIASVDEAALGLSKRHLLFGQIVPIALILKNPALKIIRYEDNGISVGLEQGPESDALPAAGPKDGESTVDKVIGWLASPGKDPDEPSFLTGLKSFEIQAARVIVDDRLLDMSWTVPRLDFRAERRTGGLYSTVSVVFEDRATQPPTLKAEAMLEAGTGKIGAEAMLEHFELSLLADRIPELAVLKDHRGMIDARLNLLIGPDRGLESAKLAVLSGTGELNIPELSEKPVPFSDAGLLAEYDGKSRQLRLKRAQLTLNGNVAVRAEAALDVGKDAFGGEAKFMIDTLRQADIGPVWPAALRGDASEKWIVHHLSDGVFSDVHALVGLEGARTEDGKWQVKAGNVTAGFSFEGMSVDYRAPLAPIREAKGSGTFDLNSETLRIDFESAKLLDMQISKADVELVNIIEGGKGKADIDITLSGPVKSALRYVKDEPISVKNTIDTDKAQGQADLHVNLVFPAHADLRVEDVRVSMKGEMRDAVLPGVVKDLTFTGGPLALGVADNSFTVSGAGKLEGRDISFEYQEFLNAQGQDHISQVKARLVADDELRARMGINLDVFMTGPAGVDVTYTQYAEGKSAADVSADLTPARVFFDPFAYEKKPGAPGGATLRAVLKDGDLKEVTGLKAKATNFLLEDSTLAFRQKGAETELSGGKISRFTLNETVAALKFDVTPEGRYDITMNGPFLDFRPFLARKDGKKEPYAHPPLRVAIAVDRMRTTDADTVQYPKISADINGQGAFEQLEMDTIAGKGDLHVHYKPDGTGKRVFRLEAADAGAALKAFAIYDNVIGGRMMISGDPVSGPYDRNLRGRAEISNFRVVKAPTLARLLGVMSLTGVTQLLNNEGLIFSKLESGFEWRSRPQGSLLFIKGGRTSGNALGLTFDGTFDLASDTTNIAGTIIPLSGINKIIGSIPLVGDIVTGGTGALIAATYSMKGPTQSPQHHGQSAGGADAGDPAPDIVRIGLSFKGAG